jgi:DNA invertase Pin-like site-specific DNA recombinase
MARLYAAIFGTPGNVMVTDIVLSVLSAVAQQERLTIGRTMAGLRRAKRAGKVLDRPSVEVDMQKVQRRPDRGESLRAIAADLGCSAALLCKRARMGSLTL